jgi:hypothetical protein
MSLATVRLTLLRFVEMIFRAFDRLSPFHWWTWRLTRRLLLVAAGGATLVALAYVVENWRGRRAYEAFAREAAAKGLSLDLADYAGPPVPDERNLAKIPLLDHPPTDGPDDPFWSELGARFQLHSSDGKARRDLPGAGRPSLWEGKPADLAALRAEIAVLNGSDPREDLDAYLARLAPLLDELNAAIAARPYLRYEYDWDKLYAIILPQVGPVRALAQVAALQALADLESGRPADAAARLRIGLRLGMAMQSEPFLISQLVANSVGSVSIAVIWQGQQGHQWSAAELAEFAALLAEHRLLEGYHNAFRAECALGITVLRQAAEKKDSNFAKYVGDEPSMAAGYARLFAAIPSGWLYQNAVTYGRVWERNVVASIDPAARRVRPERAKYSKEEFARTPYGFFASMILPSVNRLSAAAGAGQTGLDLARVAVALERHRLAHGTYPETLAPVLAADPALGALHDVFTGEPYRYRRESDGGFTLWGTGENRTDDGARMPEKRAGGGSLDLATGDLVWRVAGP